MNDDQDVFIGQVVWYWPICECMSYAFQKDYIHCQTQCLTPRAAIVQRFWDVSKDPCTLYVLPVGNEEGFTAEAQRSEDGIVNGGRWGMWTKIGGSAPIGNRPQDIPSKV